MNNQEHSIQPIFQPIVIFLTRALTSLMSTVNPFSAEAPVHMNERLQFTRVPGTKGGILAVFLRPLSDVWATVIATALASIAELRNQISHSALNIFPR